ncbi:MAG TPA: SemiSWEET family transporter [Nitrososphaera sp.]|jgi:MtN3 and saliva related transmembrane protein
MEIDTVVGISAAMLTMSSFVPQIIRAIRTHRMSDVSVYLMPLFIAGFSLWVVYGIMQDDLVIIGSNITGIIFNAILLFLKGRYKMMQRTQY